MTLLALVAVDEAPSSEYVAEVQAVEGKECVVAEVPVAVVVVAAAAAEVVRLEETLVA